MTRQVSIQLTDPTEITQGTSESLLVQLAAAVLRISLLEERITLLEAGIVIPVDPLDVVTPTLIITADKDTFTTEGETTVVTFTFSEEVVGFSVLDIISVGGLISNFSTTNNTTWTATFTQQGGLTPSISVANSVYTDMAGNVGSGASLSFLLDIEDVIIIPDPVVLSGFDFITDFSWRK